MVKIHPIGQDELPSFVALQGGPDPATALGHGLPSDRLRTLLESSFATGASRPEWCLLAEASDRPIGRVAIVAEPITKRFPLLEHRLVGLWLERWDAPGQAVGRQLIEAAVQRIERTDAPEPLTLDLRIHSASAVHRDERIRSAESSGFVMFQEKQGFVWRDKGQILDPPRGLRILSLTDVGRDAYARVVADASLDQLDRAGRHYVDLMGADRWADGIFEYLTPEDEPSWVYAETLDGQPAGYVAVGSFDEPATGTIIYIGVVRGQRGKSYGGELLDAAAVAARERGFASILSDVDTANRPMLDAMLRNGHDPAIRDWHVWHYRRELRAMHTEA